MLSNPLVRWGSLGFAIAVLGLLLFMPHKPESDKANTKSTTVIHNTASADTTVETLKTLTAEMAAVQDQNQQLITQNKELKEKDASVLNHFKEDVLQQVHQELDSYKASQQPSAATDSKSLLPAKENPNADDNLNPEYAIKHDNVTKDELNWISDMQRNSAPLVMPENHATEKSDVVSGSLLNPGETESATLQKKKKIIPYYTLPVNATLTGAIAMQPLVGRIPINGKVPDPYSFKVVIGPKNLAANGVDIPAEVQGIVASGIATGDMLGSCARGEINSLTFVFQDGRISTTEAKDGESLGHIAAANGNPCIPGEFYTNAPLYLGVTSALAGVQGYANALSQAQTSTTMNPGSNIPIASVIQNGNKFVMGQGAAAAASGAQRWWEQRIQNSFDFIYVPNVDLKTNEKLRLNINITKEIAINYDQKRRKVFYAHPNEEMLTELD